jgi:Zn-dependent metalloprotease
VSPRRPGLIAGLSGIAILVTSIGLTAGPAAAQPRAGGGDGGTRADLLARAGGHASLHTYDGSAYFGADTGHPARRPADVSPTATPAAAARGWLRHYGSLFGVDDVTADVRVDRVVPLTDGDVAVRLGQQRDGLPVVGGGLVVTLDGDNDLLGVTGRTSATPTFDSGAAAVTAGTAGVIARRAVAKHVPGARALHAEPAVLSVLDRALFGAPDTTGPVTVWDVAVTSRTAPLRHRVFVEASRGGVVLDLDENSHADRVVCDAGNSPLDDPVCPGGAATVVADPAASSDQDAVDAYRFAGAVDDFYATLLGRDSIDGNGMTLASTVNYCPTANDCPMENAFWDGAQMVYGDGYAAGLDVVGHELTHGVTQHLANVLPYYQSGAIGESLSDVFGELVQQLEGPALGAYDPADAWKLGENLAGGPFRLMDHPENGAYGADPDRMTSSNYSAFPVYNEMWDQGGVHANAGVGNKAAYLITAGPLGTGASGTFNGVTMTGVSGADAVERAVKTVNIYYRVESLLSSAATYRDLAFALPLACNQLVGDSLPTPSGTTAITTADCTQVSLAVKAVAMATPPTKAGAKVPAAAPVCTNGGGPTNKRLDLFETNPLSAGTYKRSHATGTDPYYGQQAVGDWWWSKTKIAAYGNTAAPVYQLKGSTASLWGDDADPVYFDPDLNEFSFQDARVQTTQAVKAAVGTFVRFDHAWEFDYSPYFDNSGTPYGSTKFFDGGRVEYSVDGGSHWYDAGAASAVTGKALLVNGGYNGTITNTDAYPYYADPNPLKGKKAFVGSSHGWTSSRLDLSPLKGKSVLLRWRIASDDSVGSLGWFVDNVRTYSCNPTTISLSAPTSVRKGHSADLRAHLVRSGTTVALSRKAVQLWQRRHGTTTWKKVGSPKLTNSNGNATWSRTQKVRTDYRVRFLGQLPFAPSNNATRTVAIR